MAKKSKTIGVIGIDKAPPFPRDATKRVISLLGGAKVLHMKPTSQLDWVSMIRHGFPCQAVDSLGSHIRATNSEVAEILGISTGMLARRRRGGVLSHQESERLFRVVRAIAQAEEAFEDLGNGLRWLRSPVVVMGGAAPISLLDTEIGGEVVLHTLVNIVYGLPA